MEELIPIIAIAGGIGLTIFIFDNVFKLIRAWINRNNLGEEAFNRLARAFAKYKKDSERRIENLEAIIAGDETDAQLDSAVHSMPGDAPAKSIEIEDADPKKEKRETEGSNLRNMLRE